MVKLGHYLSGQLPLLDCCLPLLAASLIGAVYLRMRRRCGSAYRRKNRKRSLSTLPILVSLLKMKFKIARDLIT